MVIKMNRVEIYFQDEEQKEKFINELNKNEKLKEIYLNRDNIIKNIITDIGDNYLPFFSYIKVNDKEHFEEIAIEYFKQSVKIELLEYNFSNPAYENLLEVLINIFMIEFTLYYDGFYFHYITNTHYID